MQKDAVRKHDEGIWPLPRDCVERVIEIRIHSHSDKLHVKVHDLGRCTRLLLRPHVEGIVGIQEEGNARELRNDLPEQLESFPLEVRRNRRQSGRVSSGPSEARDETRADGIADCDHDEGNRRRSSLDGEGGWRARGDDNIDLAGDKLGNQFRKALVLAFRPSIFDDDVTALDVAELAQTLAERADEIGLEGRGRVPEETDPVGPLQLSAQSKRRCERAGCKCDQHPSPHRH